MHPLAAPGRLALLVALAGALLPLSGAAQIQLPPKPSDARGDLAPHLLCTVCGARNYTVPSNARTNEAGLALALCAKCGKETPHRPSQEPFGNAPGHGNDARLRLPPTQRQPQATEPKVAAQPTSAPQPPISAAAAQGAAAGAPGDAAAFVFNEVGKSKNLEDPLVAKAVDSLCNMGEMGRARARAELASESVVRLVVAARTLARCGAAADLDALFARARERLPTAACAPFVEALASADPVRATPTVFADLLEHPSAPMRVAAEKVLRRSPIAELVPVLVAHAGSKNPQTRQLALGLLAGSEDARAQDALFEHLADPKPSVAQMVVQSLAAAPAGQVEARLLGIAFRDRWILREHAYALVTLIEREQRSSQPLLDERHVDALLEGLKASDIFVSGTCAAALAGIGFRGQHPRNTSWLDQEVVDRLVFTLSGKVFHDDLTAVVHLAAQRLALLTGEELATDGPRWVQWWLAAREGFVARRAWIEIAPGDEVALQARWQNASSSGALLGPTAKAPPGRNVEVFYLTEAEARELVAALRREGLFGPERLPGARGRRGPGERTLEVSVAGRGKQFVLGVDVQEPWFERSLAALQACGERNRWQLFAPAGRSQIAFWQEQSPWWSQEHEPRERDVRMKTLVLGSLAGRKPEQRGSALDELTRLYEQSSTIDPIEFEPLLGFLREEPSYNERAHRLARLAQRAALASGGGQLLEPERAQRLLSTLCERFPDEAQNDLQGILRQSPPELARQLAVDPRAPLRAACAGVLAQSTDAADQARVVKLLEDQDPRVEIAAVQAAGAARVEAARTDLIVRARLGLPAVRTAALKAIGKLGGEFVLDALLLGAADPDANVRAAAALGMAELADASAAPLLISMLAEGDGAVVFGPAREALLRLGASASTELLRVLHKSGHPARREAALILAEQGAAEPVTALFQILASNPADARVALELAVLTCVDFRGEPDPVSRWWAWYDGVTHDDALLWFRAALERVGLSVPPIETMRARGTRAGRLFLVDVLTRPEAFLAERARRELGRLLGTDLGALPPKGVQRDLWLAGWRETILAARDP